MTYIEESTNTIDGIFSFVGGANNKWKTMLEMQRQFAQEIIHEEKFQNT